MLRRILVVVAALAATIVCLVPTTSASAAGTGSLELSAGRSQYVALSGSYQDVSASAQFTVPAARTVYLGLQLRSADIGSGYRTRARVLADGAVWVGFSRVIGGQDTLLLSQPTGLKVSTGQKLNVEGAATGTSPVKLSVRAWVDGSAKPGYQQTYVDSTSGRITGSATARVWGYLSAAATGGSASTGFANASAAKIDLSTTTVPSPSSGKPSAATTGVPAGTSLTRHDGDIVVTQDGTVLDRLDIHGFVIVRANNVQITNSIVRGGHDKGVSTGLITNYDYKNLLIENVDVIAEFPSVNFDGIKGGNFTARRVHVQGNVDSVKIHGDNVTVEDSLLESTVYYNSDPNQGGGASHNDNIQILWGKNLLIRGNTIRNATNFAILGGATRGDVPNLVIDGNWLDGGHCTVKLQILNGWHETARVTNNKFGPNRKIKNCQLQVYTSVSLADGGNIMEETGVPVLPLWNNA